MNFLQGQAERFWYGPGGSIRKPCISSPLLHPPARPCGTHLLPPTLHQARWPLVATLSADPERGFSTELCGRTARFLFVSVTRTQCL